MTTKLLKLNLKFWHLEKKNKLKDKFFSVIKQNLDNIKPNVKYVKNAFVKKHSSEDNPNFMWQCIKNNLKQIIEEKVPTKMTSTRSSQPWFNTKCTKPLKNLNCTKR